LLLALFLSGCATTRPPVVSPPIIIKVPTFVSLPAACGKTQTVVLPPGSTAEQVLAAQLDAILAYEDQVHRCFASGRAP
jgi:hypothetical protein